MERRNITQNNLELSQFLPDCFAISQPCSFDAFDFQDSPHFLNDEKVTTQPTTTTDNKGIVGEVMPSPDDQGCCSAANPYVPANVAPMVLIMDIFVPGVGTVIAAYYDPTGVNRKTMTCGICQMLLTVVVVGWIWSIIQGYCIYKKSIEY